MTKFRCFMVGLALLAALPPAAAQDCSFEISMFQADLNRLSEAMQAKGFPSSAGFQEAVNDFNAQVAGLSPIEAANLCNLLDNHPSVKEAPGALLSALDSYRSTGPEGFICLTEEQHIILASIRFGLAVASAVAGGICQGTQCVEFACVIPCTVAAVLNGLLLPFDFVLNEDNYCFGGLIFAQDSETLSGVTDLLTNVEGVSNSLAAKLDATVSSRSTQQSVNQALAALSTLDTKTNALSSMLTAHNTSVAAAHDLDLRLKIEAILQSGQSGRISLFQLPNQFGGYLERVREIVADTIQKTQAAGLSIGRALEFFDEADRQFNMHKYRDAFNAYRRSYQEAVNGLSP